MKLRARCAKIGLVASTILTVSMLPVSGASGATETVTSGHISASYHYVGTYPQSKDSSLTIFESGRVVFFHAVNSKWCGDACWPAISINSKVAVHLVKLRPHGLANVVLDFYSGGAHCCSIEQVFVPTKQKGAYVKYEYNFGDPGERLVKIGPDDTYDFLSADDAFAYAFSDYAASGLPLKILSLSNGRFVDVTRKFPRRIAADAAQWLKAFEQSASTHYDDTTGLVAAWAADEELLGHASAVTTFLDEQSKLGHLNSALSPIEPSGGAYVKALATFLRQHGYIRQRA